MVTRTYKIRITIPNWLYRFRWQNLKNYFSYQLNPPRCPQCGKKKAYTKGGCDLWIADDERDNFHYPLRRSLGVGCHSDLCKSCFHNEFVKFTLSDEFNAMQRKDLYNTADECEVCNRKVRSYKAVRLSNKPIDFIRFCTCGSWNGHYVCLDCAKLATAYGEERSGIYQQYKGKSTPTNRWGLPVINGKVRFPE